MSTEAKKTTTDIANYIVESVQDDLAQITRQTYGGGFGPDHDIYTLNVTLNSGEKFFISVTKIS